MNHTPELERVDASNVAECGIGCLLNRRHPGYQAKVDWLAERFEEGLRYLLFRDDAGKPLAFLEYVPGEYAWRPVKAAGWLFVHCLWVYPRGQTFDGLGSGLIRACLDEARAQDLTGVVAMVSDGPWMAGKGVFLRNGFETVDQADRFELVAYRLKDGPAPSFCAVDESLARYDGLHLVYSSQCPMLPKSAADVAEMAAEHGIELEVHVLRTPKEAQRAPSYYGVFNLVWNGRLIADHYVSKGRFRGILKNELRDAPRGGSMGRTD